MIVHLITCLDVGGAELVLANLLAGLPPEERQHHRVISLIAPGVVADKIRALGVAVSSVDMQRGRPTLGALFKLRRDLATTPGWFVHGWMYHANLMASLVCLLALKPRRHLWAVRNALVHMDNEKPLTQKIIRLCAKLSFLPRAIVYDSLRAAEQHEKLGYARRKRNLIPNGYDLSRFKPDPSARARLGIDASVLIGHVGRWDWSKDHANFLAALAQVPGVHGVLVGGNITAGNPDLMALVRKYGVEDRVHLLGYRGDVESIMPAFDVMCLSSRTESMPNVVCEAMACGVPCVVTDVGGASLMVGDTGFVVPPEDSAALASALARMLASDYKTLGGQARERVSAEFDRQKMLDAYRSLYAALGWT